MKKRLSLLLASAILVGSMGPISGMADELEQIEVKEQEIEANQNLIQNQLMEIEAVDADINFAFAEIERLSQERAILTEEIQALKLEIEDLEESIKENESEKARLEKELEDKIQVFKKRLDVMYKNRNIGTINVLMESESADDFLTRLNSMKAVAGYDKDIIEELNSIKAELELLLIELKGTKASLDQAYENLTYKEALLLDSIHDQQGYVAILENNRSLAQSEVARLNGIVDSLNAEIDDLNTQYQERLKKEEEERLARERAAAEAARLAAQSSLSSSESPTSYEAVNATYVPFSGDVTYFNQREEPWASHTYGTGIYSSIHANGCGPTSMAMVISSLTDQYVTPIQMADYAMANGHVMPGDGGSYWSLFPAASSLYGLSCTQSYNRDQINQALSNGALVIASQDNSLGNYWTYGGHFIVLTGIDENGYISVADPWSRSKSVVSHSQNYIYTPMKSAWIITGK